MCVCMCIYVMTRMYLVQYSVVGDTNLSRQLFCDFKLTFLVKKVNLLLKKWTSKVLKINI